MKRKPAIWVWGLVAGLVVCTVVVFAVFWPKYQMYRVVKRVHSDLRLLAIALEQVTVDSGEYPPDEPGLKFLIHPVRIGMAMGVAESYLPENVAELPTDPFNNHGRGLYGYAAGSPVGKPFGEEPNVNFYILTSYGPDRDQDFDPQLVAPRIVGRAIRCLCQDQPLETFAYDPTNGLISNGDIYRCKW